MGAMLVRHEPTSAATVRREIAVDLAGNGVSDDRVADVALVASELIGNAVRHSDLPLGEAFDVTWTIGATAIEVSVADRSRIQPTPRLTSAADTTGRGLCIVEAIASGWGVEPTSDGKRVWALIPLN